MGFVPREGDIDVKFYSELYEQDLEGTFRVRRRTIGDISVVAQKLSGATNGAVMVSNAHSYMLNAISELSEVIIKSPDWWQTALDDCEQDAIRIVYNTYLEWYKRPFRFQREQDERRNANNGAVAIP